MAVCARLNRLLKARQMLQRFSRDTTGAVAVMAALAFPVLVGGMALGAEASFWYLSQRKMQQAADLAAHAAALQKRSGRSPAEIMDAAKHIAEGNHFHPVTNPGDDTLTVTSPPTTGSFAGRATAVEVVLTRQQTRYFTLIYSPEDVVISARAVVEVGRDACVLSLSPTGQGISVEGSADVVFQGCDVATNSSAHDAFHMQGGKAEFTAGCIHSVGRVDVDVPTNLHLTTCTAANINAPATQDPYADLAEPPNGTCLANPATSTETYLGMRVYRHCDLAVSSNRNFPPGLHIIQGGTFSINGSIDVSGTDVTFFLMNGVGMKFNGTAKINLSAPTSGPFSGILFYGARSSVGTKHIINGNAGSTLSGTVYLPTGDLTYTGNFGGPNKCTQLVT